MRVLNVSGYDTFFNKSDRKTNNCKNPPKTIESNSITSVF